MTTTGIKRWKKRNWGVVKGSQKAVSFLDKCIKIHTQPPNNEWYIKDSAMRIQC